MVCYTETIAESAATRHAGGPDHERPERDGYRRTPPSIDEIPGDEAAQAKESADGASDLSWQNWNLLRFSRRNQSHTDAGRRRSPVLQNATPISISSSSVMDRIVNGSSRRPRKSRGSLHGLATSIVKAQCFTRLGCVLVGLGRRASGSVDDLAASIALVATQFTTIHTRDQLSARR